MSSPPLCAYCRQRPVEHRWRPFCSERCKMTDLGRWLAGDYRVAGRAERSGESDETEPSTDHRHTH